jgi:CubicO group peptidase (beta-lactamase class C family)
MPNSTPILQNLINKKIDNKNIHGIILNIERGNGEIVFKSSAGNLQVKTQYFIASTTKLYTTALIMKMVSEGKISLKDKLEKFFPSEIIANLNNYKGKDYSYEITIKDLLSHTSGIPDYFMGKLLNGQSLQNALSLGKDQSWTFEEAISMAKLIKPKFAPGQKDKALYSDTNYQILGKIIEIIMQEPINKVYESEIFKQFNTNKTYLYTNPKDITPFTLYYKAKPLNIPLAMTSFQADGGIVSTLDDSMQFIKAFFDGSIFPKSYLEEMTSVFNRIFFPLKYGTGLMKFDFPAIFTLFRKTPLLLGHSGLSGAFEYYCPELDVYVVGTVNQVANPSNSYRLLIEIMQILKKGL